MDAFHEAKKDVEKQKKLKERRDRFKEMMKADENFDEKVHKENLEEEIYVTWQRICMFDEDKMLLSDIVNGSTDDLLARFISILYLAIESKIRIHQRRFPYGEIVIKNMTPVEERLKAPTMELAEEEVEPEQVAGEIALA